MNRVRVLSTTVAVAALIATGCEWHFETLDGNGGPNGRVIADVGEHTTAVVYNSRPHVFYFDDVPDTLHHTWFG